ncbi:MAG: lamin tail domain-containing protein [Chitinophagaceae bacterium]
MKTNILFTIAVFLSFSANAQLIDDFEDGDLMSAPAWSGNLSSFTTFSYQLRTQSTLSNTSFYISTEVSIETMLQFEFDVRLMFNTSSLNYVDVYLFADSANLKTVKNGVFVRTGGSTDEVSLYKIQNGIESEIIDGKDAVLNNSDNQFKVRIIFENDSFYLYRSLKTVINWFKEGSCFYELPQGNFYSGFKIRQSTSSFFGKHFFDNFYSGPILRDTVAPLIDSVFYDDSSMLHVYFNEPIDTSILFDSSHWSFTSDSIHPYGVGFLNQGRVAVFNCATLLPANQLIHLYIIELSDLTGNKCDTSFSFFTLKKEIAEHGDLIITELMIDPDPVLGLPNLEYVEIQNVSQKYISLNNCRVSDPGTYKLLPVLVLPPDSILVLYSIPSLNNSSDIIRLINPKACIIDQVEYASSWYADSVKSKGGYSLERIDLTNNCLGAENWKASLSSEGGTPGLVNSVNAKLPKDTVPPQILSFRPIMPDKIKVILNEPFDSVTMSSLNFTINDKYVQYAINYQIPSQQLIEFKLPGKFNESIMYRFTISGFKDCPGNASENYSISSRFLSVPASFDVVINEVLFNPRSGNHDFIELYNRSEKSFDVSELFLADFKDGHIRTIYPLTSGRLNFDPGKYLLLSEDTNEICQTYNCSFNALKCQPKKLPSLPDAAGEFALINIESQIIDSLFYSADWHFKLLNDQNGISLERLNPDNLQHLQSNWHSAASVYGYATPGARNSQVILPVKNDQYFNPSSRTLSPDGDGFQDVFIINYTLPENNYAATVSVFDMNGRLMYQILNHQSLGSRGELVWDGLSSAGSTLSPGIYIITIDATSPAGKRIREQFTIILCNQK